MDNTYSINPNPIPQTPMTSEEHHRMLNLLMILVAVALIIGMLYWWTSMNSRNPTGIPESTDMRAQVAAILRNSPVHVSQAEIESVAAQLAKSKVPATAADRQAVANILKQ